MPSSIEFIKSGKLRALAVTTDVRNEALPDVPVVADTVPGYEATRLVRHRGAERHARQHRRKINKTVNDALADAKMKGRLADLGGIPMGGTRLTSAR